MFTEATKWLLASLRSTHPPFKSTAASKHVKERKAAGWLQGGTDVKRAVLY